MSVAAAPVPCGLVVFDDDLHVVDANEHAAQLVGWPVPELLTRSLPDLLSRGGQIFFHTHVNPALALQGHIEEVYLHLRTRAGEDVPVVVNGSREGDGAGVRNTLAFLPMRRRQLFEHELVAARDAAEEAARLEREAQAQIKQAHAQLALRERLASLGTLAHGIAHEVNNPLTYVITSLELMAEALGGADELDRDDLLALTHDAREGTERIREITRQMSSLVRADELPRVPLDPRTVVSMVARMTKAHTRERATVELVLDDVPLVDADSGRLGQVLINLVVNATHAFGDRPAAGNLVRLKTSTGSDGFARIEVSDNGPGMPPEVAARAFEPFFTTKPVGEGTGLGLSISRGLVESLGGALTFETEPGSGTTFRITMPPSPAVRSDGELAAGARRRVLVVDDDDGVVQTLARVLRSHHVTTALSAEEAMARIRSETPFDFVFSDLRLPSRSGLALHEAIAAVDPKLARRMAFVTGTLTEEVRRQVDASGLQVFTEPLDLAALSAFCDEQLSVTPPTP